MLLVLWSSDIKSVLSSIDQARAFQTRNMVCTKAAWACYMTLIVISGKLNL